MGYTTNLYPYELAKFRYCELFKEEEEEEAEEAVHGKGMVAPECRRQLFDSLGKGMLMNVRKRHISTQE